MPVLTAVLAALHTFDEEVNWAKPVQFEFVLRGWPTLRVSARGGDHVNFDQTGMEPFDMGEAGRIEIVDFTEQFAVGLRGEDIEMPLLIHDGGMRAIGLAIRSAIRHPVCLWIGNDEWNWGTVEALCNSSFGPGITPVVSSDHVKW